MDKVIQNGLLVLIAISSLFVSYICKGKEQEIQNLPLVEIEAEEIEKDYDYTIIPEKEEVSMQIKIEPIKEKEVPEEAETETIAKTEIVAEVTEEVTEITEIAETYYTASQFKYLGVVWYGGWRWTWYSERVLPGGGLSIPDRHNDENGYICDENDYICIASSVLPKGTVVDTPFGKQGKVYDCGCAADTLDVYVGW